MHRDADPTTKRAATRSPFGAIRRAALGLALLLLLVVVPGVSVAESPLSGLAPATAPVPATVQQLHDPLGRETPKGLINGLLGAMADEDYARASRYLNLELIAPERRERRGAELARELQQLLDKGGWLATNWQMSSEPEGSLDDGLAADKERFAAILTRDGQVELIADRVADADAGQLWLVSSQTIESIPMLLARGTASPLERWLPALSNGPRVGGAPIGQWAVLLLIAALSLPLGALSTSIGVTIVRAIWGKPGPRVARWLDAARKPLGIYLGVMLFLTTTGLIGVSVVARKSFGFAAEIVGWAALAWFLWRVADALAELGVDRMSRNGRVGTLSAMRFLLRSAKFLVAAVAMIAGLDTLGFDVTAGLAAIGIGGIAIALGAQRTVEHFVGSISLLADQPVRVGDFCKFGTTMGTVEDIGLRSTSVRTLDRTVVTVPNGLFSAMQIENFSRRDRFWFNPTLRLRYDTSPDQLRFLLVEVRQMLYSHPRVDPDPARVRFLGFGTDSLTLEVFAYVHAPDFSEFLEVQEDLNLRIMDLIAASGASFGFTARTLYPVPDFAAAAAAASTASAAGDAGPANIGPASAGTPRARRELAEARVREMAEAGELPLPRFPAQRIDALKGRIAYPPQGSVDSALRDESQLALALEPPPASPAQTVGAGGSWSWRWKGFPFVGR